ncbi:MAG TPA: M50 family metallopeptidase [Verrucomicrobiae bacterium]|nr:M50 family metallopeptidase [Verrucomicrobiae bacterium]
MKLGTIFGVKVMVSPYLVALMALYMGLGIWPQAMAVFTLVFVHEWVHILAAKGYGIEVEGVELYPFGGVARLRGLFEADPVVETVVALVGPASNLLLALIGVVLGQTHWLNNELIDFFVTANLSVAIFNLCPALPLDGGRVLRAWLTNRVGYRKATGQAAAIGRIAGIVLGLGGIVLAVMKIADVTPAMIGVFLYLTARKEGKEAQFVFVRYLNRKREELLKQGILRTHVLAAKPEQPVKDVVKQVLPQRFMIVHIIDDQFKIHNSLTETQVIKALFEEGIDYPIGQVDKTG